MKECFKMFDSRLRALVWTRRTHIQTFSFLELLLEQNTLPNEVFKEHYLSHLGPGCEVDHGLLRDASLARPGLCLLVLGLADGGHVTWLLASDWLLVHGEALQAMQPRRRVHRELQGVLGQLAAVSVSVYPET